MTLFRGPVLPTTALPGPEGWIVGDDPGDEQHARHHDARHDAGHKPEEAPVHEPIVFDEGMQAFWHAATGTPIDEAPARVHIPDVVEHHYDAHHGEWIYVFADGVVIKLYQDDVVTARRDRRYVQTLVEQRYLEAREARA